MVMVIFFIVLVMLFIILVIIILVVMVVMALIVMVSKAPMRTRCLKYESKFWTLYVVSMMRYYFRCRPTPTKGSFS